MTRTRTRQKIDAGLKARVSDLGARGSPTWARTALAVLDRSPRPRPRARAEEGAVRGVGAASVAKVSVVLPTATSRCPRVHAQHGPGSEPGPPEARTRFHWINSSSAREATRRSRRETRSTPSDQEHDGETERAAVEGPTERRILDHPMRQGFGLDPRV